MQVELDLGFAPNDEVDDLAWLRREEARGKLSYPPDREVLDALVASAGSGACGS
jgi:predicted NUDIX family NTP pyrophosphohydrolase